jgi:hypothetical protein
VPQGAKVPVQVIFPGHGLSFVVVIRGVDHPTKANLRCTRPPVMARLFRIFVGVSPESPAMVRGEKMTIEVKWMSQGNV